MKITERETDNFHEALPGTMDQPGAWIQRPENRGMWALLLVPLAIMGGLAIWGAKKMQDNSHQPADGGKEIPE